MKDVDLEIEAEKIRQHDMKELEDFLDENNLDVQVCVDVLRKYGWNCTYVGE